MKFPYDINISTLLFMSLGIFVTMPVVAVNINGNSFSFFSILLCILICYMIIKLFKKRRIKLKGISKILLLWFYIALIASIFGLLWFSDVLMREWFNASLSYIPKIVLYIVFLVLYSSTDICEKYEKPIIKGIMIGSIANIFFSIIDGLIYYIFKISIANTLFKTYIVNNSIRYESLSLLLNNGSIRSSGFNYDPAHLGMLIPMVFYFGIKKNNFFIVIASLISIFMSQSTTAFVCCVIILIVNIKNIHFTVSFQNALKRIFSLIILILVCLLLVNLFDEKNIALNAIKLAMNNFGERVNSNYIEGLDKDDPRLIYYLNLIVAMLTNGLKTITGTGFGTASYPYLYNEALLDKLNLSTIKMPYDPESTYVSYLFDTGIVGIIVYIILLYILWKFFKTKQDKNDENLILFSGLNALIFSSFFYHYTIFACQVLLLIICVVRMDKIRENTNKVKNKTQK